MDAFGGLLRLHRVDTIFCFPAFLRDGENAERGDGFEWVIGFRMHHAHANGSKIANINERRSQDERGSRALGERANRKQADYPSDYLDRAIFTGCFASDTSEAPTVFPLEFQRVCRS